MLVNGSVGEKGGRGIGAREGQREKEREKEGERTEEGRDLYYFGPFILCSNKDENTKCNFVNLDVLLK